MLRLKLLILVALVIALAAIGAGWKWKPSPPRPGASGAERTALGWTWDGPVVAHGHNADDQGDDEQ